MSERPSQAEIDEANASNIQEVEEQIAELERKLAAQMSQNNFDAARLRRLATRCAVSVPESDEELLQVAGVVIGSCLRAMDNPTSSQISQAVAQAKSEQKEEDAKICDNIRAKHFNHPVPDAYLTAQDCAEAIRNAPSLP